MPPPHVDGGGVVGGGVPHPVVPVGEMAPIGARSPCLACPDFLSGLHVVPVAQLHALPECDRIRQHASPNRPRPRQLSMVIGMAALVAWLPDASVTRAASV